MPHPRTAAALFSALLVTFAFALERLPRHPDGLLEALIRVELTHLVAHSLLYGALAAMLASWWFPLEPEDRSMSLRRKAIAASLCFIAAAGAQELTQALSRHRLPAGEELFDLAVDITGATLGLIAWSYTDPRRGRPVARALGVVLHPGFVGLAGVFAVTWASLRDARAGLTWTALAALAVLPVAIFWVYGLRRGRFSDADLSVRAERPPFLAASCLAALALYLATCGLGAPPIVRSLCLAGAVASVLVTAATLGGLKVSGHVAVPVGVVALIHVSSARGVWPFAVAAVALSWARVREGRHTPREVAGAWGLAIASATLALG
ncbi:MAG: hypothetical protein R3A48_26780 [Polyangiales bacterium]